MEFNLDIPRSGYFIVYKGDKSFFCNQIRNAQRKEGFSEEDADYTHVEPSIGGQYSIYANLPKVRAADITRTGKGRYVKIVKMNFNRVPFRYVEELREKYELQDRYKVATWCATRCNIPYSIPGVLWFKIRKVLKKNILSSIGDFCSELSGFGIWREYVHTEKCKLEEVLPRYFGELYPADFLNKDYFDIVWEGEIS